MTTQRYHKQNTGWPDALPPLAEALRSPQQYRRHLRARIEQRLADRDTRAGSWLLLAGAGFLLLFLFYWMFLLWQVPTVGELEEARYAEATVAYTANGKVLTRYQTKNRTWVPLDSISTNVTEALVATEDRRFYEHQGIDVMRTGGAILQTLTGDAQGGSTITMQLARNAFPDIGDDFILTRKMKEWLTALRIEDRFGKEEILEMYLNTVPFMYGAFGIESAARTYFQKSASELDVLEAATLVGMLKATVYYNPKRHPERSRERRNVVLQQMAEHGGLAAETHQALKEQPTPLNFKRLTRADNRAPYFAEYLRQRLDKWAEEHGYNLYTSGLRIHTTLDASLQAAAESAVKRVADNLQAVADVEWSRPSVPYFSSQFSAYPDYRQRVEPFAYFWRAHPKLLNRVIRQTARYKQLTEQGQQEDEALAQLKENAAFLDSIKAAAQRLEAGFVAIDPHSGHVRAWVGGRDFDKDEYDHVALAQRQPGSTFKPFVYAAALEEGYSPKDRLRDEVVTYDVGSDDPWRPKNVGGSSGELLTVSEGLALSKNTITAKLITDIGPGRVADLAHRMGIESELREVPSLGLGTSPVTLREMATAYSTLAAQGRYHEPVLITRIEDESGRVLERFSTEERRAISAQTAYGTLDMMRGVVNFGTGQRIRTVFDARGDLAGKTGTTQNSADGWFMLLHPNLVMGAWVGFNNPAVTFRSNYWGQGAHNALYIVGNVFQEADLSRDASFEEPPGYHLPEPSRGWSDSLVARADSLSASEDTLDGDSSDTAAHGEPLELDATAAPPPEDQGAPASQESPDAEEPPAPERPTMPVSNEEASPPENEREREKQTDRPQQPARQETPDPPPTGTPPKQQETAPEQPATQQEKPEGWSKQEDEPSPNKPAPDTTRRAPKGW